MITSSKIKGGLGVLKVAEFFIAKSIPVFTELFCDNSEIDLIIQYNGLHSIQVRSTTSIDGVAILRVLKVTPGTRKTFCKRRPFSDAVEVFALYVMDMDTILWIDRNEIKNIKSRVYFRFSEPKNNQQGGIRFATEYLTPSFLI